MALSIHTTSTSAIFSPPKMEEDRTRYILHLFIRPGEPVYIPKGDKNVIFEIPVEWFPDKFQPVANKIIDRIILPKDDIKTTITVVPIDLPDITYLKNLGRDDQFSVFIPEHSKMAGHLIKIFMDMKTFDEFLSVAVYCRDQLNSFMYIYALSVAILNRPDTKHLSIPSLAQVFPDQFINGINLKHVKEEVNLVPADHRRVIEIKRDFSASDLEAEHRVAYFREDLAVNLHHWHWHLVYPNADGMEIVAKDRRGELFYYMHRQMVARYNFERLSTNLFHVKSLVDWRLPMTEAYFSKLNFDYGTKFYPPRQTETMLMDVNRPERTIHLLTLERFRDRIVDAIHQGAVIDENGKTIKLDESKGIDILGNMVESSILSPNRTFYGNLHNNGHVAIGSSHDPDYRHLEGMGVMANNATAVRDPIFFRWHSFIDDIFQEHKRTLKPYTKKELEYKDIKVGWINVKTEHQIGDALHTTWQQSEVDISGGLDFQQTGKALVRFTHLDHLPFNYEITVTNDSATNKMGTVRIFMAPALDERGLPFDPESQRLFMIEMDKFAVNLIPGKNNIVRKSTDSSVTIPFEQTFPKVFEDKEISDDGPTDSDWCGCGWPQHMLVPKGTVDGMPVHLFVMVSNYDDDKVELAKETRCKDAVSYCGLRDKKYPDARAMGYPFDRPVPEENEILKDFLTPNMCVKELRIILSEKQPGLSSTTCPIITED